MWLVVAVFICNLSVLAAGQLNYCGSRMCSYTNAHTFCQFSGGPGSQCIGYVETPLTTEEKIRLVIRLNQRRAAVATGRLRGFPTAGNMMKLLWMEELAREAQLWADQCEPPSTPEENDACRDLYSVTIGQCVASVIGEAPGLRPESMVDIWYMQNMFYKGNVTSYDAPVNNRYNYYGDFAQLVYSKTYMVGCGRSRFMVLMSGRLRSVERLVCNFAPRGPSAGRPLWTVASPGSACPPQSRPDDYVPSLCSVQRDIDESQDQENLMTLEEHILLETVFEIVKNESLNYLGSLDEIFLTKVAVATIRDIVTTPMEPNTLQTIAFFNSIEQKSKKTEDKKSSQYYKSKSKVVLVGRPKSYNIEELNDGNEELNNDNPDTQMQDLPIKEKHFEVDYEFSEISEQRRTVSTDKPTTDTSISTSTTSTSTTATIASVYETFMKTLESKNKPLPTTLTSAQTFFTEDTTSTKSSIRVTPYTESIYKLDDFNLTMAENDTDALLEEYLSDPETVKRIQEELYRMEQTMSSASPKPPTLSAATDRAEKVRRALKDDTDRQKPSGQAYLENSTMHYPQLLQMFSGDENKSISNPVMSMAMRYMPFLNKYKNGLTKSVFSHSNGCIVNQCILIVVFCVINVF